MAGTLAPQDGMHRVVFAPGTALYTVTGAMMTAATASISSQTVCC